MKHHHIYNTHLLLLTAIGLWLGMLQACEIEKSGNGNLDGFWRLEQIDTMATGGHTDLTASNRFWSFQGKLVVLQKTWQKNPSNSDDPDIICSFERDGDTLRLFSPNFLFRPEGDPPMKQNDIHFLMPYGVNQLDESFFIRHISSKHLILETPELRINLEKF